MIEKENPIEKAQNNDMKIPVTSENKKIVFWLKIIIPILVGIVSFSLLANKFSDVSFHQRTINILDKKQETVLKLSLGASSLAAGTSLFLGDRATPISNKLLDLTGYLLLILTAIMLEKYLVTIMGFASFKIIIPISCILFSLFTIIDIEKIRKIAFKLFIFALVAFFVVPTSVEISDIIEKTYEVSIEQDITEINEIANEINNSDIEELENEVNNSNSSDDNSSIFDFFKNSAKKITEVVGGAINSVKDEATKLIEKVTTQLNNLIEKIAIMIVTTCVIPITVIIFFSWLIRLFFNICINIDFKSIKNPTKLLK